MVRALVVGLVVVSSASPLAALVPSTDSYLPSVGHGVGQCVGQPPVCAEWRTTVWIFNPSPTRTANVQMSFLYRDQANTAPMTRSLAIQPGQVREIDEVLRTEFGIQSAYGALRFTSDRPVYASGRVFDANVPIGAAAGTAGAFSPVVTAAQAIGKGERLDLFGLAQEPAWRTNFGFVETTGNGCTVEVQRLDESGAALGAARRYQVLARSPRQLSLTEVPGAGGANQRLSVTVVDGTGRIAAFAWRMDNRTGDPSGIDAAGAGRDGTYVGKLDKPQYDTPLTFTVAGGAVTSMDATVIFTNEEISTCGGELVRLAGALPQPVLVEDGTVSFSIGGTVEGVGVTVRVDATIAVDGRLSGTVATTLTGAGSCSGSKTWPLIGARLP